jgi:hypothetical protein
MRTLNPPTVNKINNRFIDRAKVVIEVDGEVWKEEVLDLGSDAPNMARLMHRKYADKLNKQEKPWELYISFIHY